MNFFKVFFLAAIFVLNECSVIKQQSALDLDVQKSVKANLIRLSLCGNDRSCLLNQRMDNSESFLSQIEILKNQPSPRCFDCYDAAETCYYSSGSWFNDECTYAANVCYSCGMTLAGAISWLFGK